MKISVFSSGSAGNCTLVQTKSFNILIDVGISKKSLEENLLDYNLTLHDIQLVFITHEHIDHIRALPTVLKYDTLRIYLTVGTYHWILENNKKRQPSLAELMEKRLNNGSIVLLNRIENSIFYSSFEYYNLKIQVLPTFHDAVESVGFVIEDEKKRLVYITDTGYVHEALYPMIYNAEAYILESNHDPTILMHSNRTYALKMRILSNHGHLSNEDSMVTLAHIIGDKTKLVMHAHISQECNLTQIVEMTREQVLKEYGVDTSNIEFVITSPVPSKEYEI